MELQDKFYSAPEVSQVLGVTLRSLYRYIRDGKIETFKTAGGRLRFTREAIMDFMGPETRKAPVARESIDRTVISQRVTPRVRPVQEEDYEPEVTEEKVERIRIPLRPVAARDSRTAARVMPTFDEPIRPVASRRQPEEMAPVRAPVVSSLYDEEEDIAEDIKEAPEETNQEPAPQKLYYKSNIKDLRLLAQKIQKSCQNAHVPYSLTGYAGMSLHQEMPPFSVIHIYVRLDDLPFFENILQCQEVTNEDDANICFLEVPDLDFWQQVETFKGFKVVNSTRLEADLAEI